MKTHFVELCENDPQVRDLNFQKDFELQKIDVMEKEQLDVVSMGTPQLVNKPPGEKQFQSTQKQEYKVISSTEQLREATELKYEKEVSNRLHEMSRDPLYRQAYIEHLQQKRKEHRQSLEKGNQQETPKRQDKVLSDNKLNQPTKKPKTDKIESKQLNQQQTQQQKLNQQRIEILEAFQGNSKEITEKSQNNQTQENSKVELTREEKIQREKKALLQAFQEQKEHLNSRSRDR